MLQRILAAMLVCASPAKAAEVHQQNAIELGDFGGRLRSIRLSVNGQEGLFTIDTGGGVSLISPDFARRIGCEPWGAHTGFRLTGERLDIPRCEDVVFELPTGAKLATVSAGVIDLQPLLFKDAPPVDGSIALDAFEGQAFTIDLGAGTLTMETPQTLKARTPHAAEIPMRRVRQAAGHALGVVIPVATAKGKLWMSLDSGGGAPILLRDTVAVEAGADPELEGAQPYVLSPLGGEKIKVATRAIVRDMILDGVIGMPVLVHWSLTIDLANDRLWVTNSPR